MTRKDYTDRVTACLRGLTRSERESIRAEIDAHMEDHICGLMELGYSEELAEERTMLRMGDPEEVGRELRKQYPFRWRLLTWLTAPVLMYMMLYIMLLAPHDEYAFVCNNAERFSPRMHVSHTIQASIREDVDIRFDLGDDQVRVLQVAVGEGCASVYADSYNQLPFGPVARAKLVLENQRGERGAAWCLGMGRWWAHGSVDVPIRSEDTYVTLCCDQYGENIRLRIALPKEAVP